MVVVSCTQKLLVLGVSLEIVMATRLLVFFSLDGKRDASKVELLGLLHDLHATWERGVKHLICVMYFYLYTYIFLN